jgi:hypothetical protein
LLTGNIPFENPRGVAAVRMYVHNFSTGESARKEGNYLRTKSTSNPAAIIIDTMMTNRRREPVNRMMLCRLSL